MEPTAHQNDPRHRTVHASHPDHPFPTLGLTPADTAIATDNGGNTDGGTMQFLRRDNGELNGSVGDGRDDIPAPTACDVASIRLPEPTDGIVLSDALLALRRASQQFNVVSATYEQAWTRYVAEELARREPRALALWLEVLDGEAVLVPMLQLTGGDLVGVSSIADGPQMAELCEDYYNAVMPYAGIDILRRAQLSADSDVDRLAEGLDIGR
jgi:hypothetical protein